MEEIVFQRTTMLTSLRSKWGMGLGRELEGMGVGEGVEIEIGTKNEKKIIGLFFKKYKRKQIIKKKIKKGLLYLIFCM